MTGCPSLSGEATDGIASALRVVDCQTAQATSIAFGRLFGAHGALLPALTIGLTIYVALLALALLTGRTRIGLAALTPRMLALGLVLTFATSWAAYQSVVWNIASGAPDEIASLLIGSRGSATLAFADRLDALFVAVADAAHQASQPGQPTDTGITPAAATVGTFSASTVLWLSATMLLLGTVGVLLTAKIALAALLALGPVFIVLALFPATRSLFEGWLKAATLFALVPLLTVLIGGGGIAMMAPLVRSVELAGSDPSPQEVAAVFLGASVFVALMVMVLKTAGTLVYGWRLPFVGERVAEAPYGAANGASSARFAATTTPVTTSATDPVVSRDERIGGIVSALPAATASDAGSPGRVGRVRRVAADIMPVGPAFSPAHDQRVQALRRGRIARPPSFSRKGIS